MATPDDFLPRYQFFESHEGSVAAPPKPVLDAAATLEDRDDALVRALLTLRELPARIAGALGLPGALKDEPRFGIKNFTLLARDETSLVLGLVGRFWRPSFGLLPIADAQEFLAFEQGGVARLVMSFSATPDGAGGVRLITQTRVYCPDRASLAAFTPYWLLIRGASGLIRRRMLAAIRRKAEASAALSS